MRCFLYFILFFGTSVTPSLAGTLIVYGEGMKEVQAEIAPRVARSLTGQKSAVAFEDTGEVTCGGDCGPVDLILYVGRTTKDGRVFPLTDNMNAIVKKLSWASKVDVQVLSLFEAHNADHGSGFGDTSPYRPTLQVWKSALEGKAEVKDLSYTELRLVPVENEVEQGLINLRFKHNVLYGLMAITTFVTGLVLALNNEKIGLGFLNLSHNIAMALGLGPSVAPTLLLIWNHHLRFRHRMNYASTPEEIFTHPTKANFIYRNAQGRVEHREIEPHELDTWVDAQPTCIRSAMNAVLMEHHL